MKSILLLCLTLCFAPNAFAESQIQQECAEGVQYFENTQVHMLESGGRCYLSLHPRNSTNLLYRDFMFDDVGLFMIFDSYGEGRESETTAAREFLFFPRKVDLAFAYDAGTKLLQVQSPSGKIFTFDAVKTILLGISGTSLQLSYDIVPERKGGVEVVSSDNLYLEGGYKRGQAPSQNPKNKIYFVDSEKKSCRVYNADVYRYNSDQDSTFRFNDAQLKQFLKSNCPQLDFNP